jgi:plasmid stabilization system protein ParE
MEEKARLVVYSDKALAAIHDIFEYGTDTFSPFSAETFVLELLDKIDALS